MSSSSAPKAAGVSPASAATPAKRARKAETPWRGWSPKPAVVSNAMRQQQARKKLSEFELLSGVPLEEFEAEQAAMRARVREQYGLATTRGKG